jgi:Ankyrin repeats (many copies)/Putative peptidoglycan binding domain/Ankyrin repeat
LRIAFTIQKRKDTYSQTIGIRRDILTPMNYRRGFQRVYAVLAIAWIATVSATTAAVAQQRPSVIDAVHKGHAVGHESDGVEAVGKALAAGGDVNERDTNGWTPLMHACLECRPEIVRLLLERGADVRLRASRARATLFVDHGQSALIIGASCFIARQRASLAPERGMPQSYVATELAASEKIVSELIRAGADINSADADGQTPLMTAAQQGWTGVVRELLAAKAMVNARDIEGRLAIDYADPQDKAIVSLLQQAGSTPATGHSGRTVCDAERALDLLGYKTPIIDCIAGQQLRAALVKFQSEKKLQTTGELDEATRQSLKIR